MRISFIAALTASALLTGCGATATDREVATAASASSSTTSTSRPTGSPWPRYPEDDYTYELRLNCYCADRGPFLITVHDGTVTDAVYGRGAVGHSAGQHVSAGWVRMTINDVIRRANDPRQGEVDVHWRRNQGYPSSVWFNRSKMPVDGGIQYQLRNVRPT